MSTTAIQIEVDNNSAEVFAKAPAEQRKQIELLLRLRLRELTSPSARSLTQIMDQIGQSAEDQGMTEELLRELLDEP